LPPPDGGGGRGLGASRRGGFVGGCFRAALRPAANSLEPLQEPDWHGGLRARRIGRRLGTPHLDGTRAARSRPPGRTDGALRLLRRIPSLAPERQPDRAAAV